jgi:hypothetical protein
MFHVKKNLQLIVSGETEPGLLEVPRHGLHLGEDVRLVLPQPRINYSRVSRESSGGPPP